MSREVKQIMDNLNNILNRLKEKLNIKNDAELMRKLNLSSGVISNWKARNKIPFSEIFTICEENAFNINYIFYGTNEENSLKNDENLSKTQKEIFRKLNELDPIQQKFILNKIDNEILKNEEKEIELLKNNILRNFSNFNSENKIVLEEFERDDKTYKAVYISDEWNLELERDTYIEDDKKSFIELLRMLNKNLKEMNEN